MHGQEYRRSWSNHHSHSPKYVHIFFFLAKPNVWPQYIGLQILEKLIQTRWKSLPDGQRQGTLRNLTRSVRIMLISHIGIRNFVVGITVKIASDETSLRREKTYINKLNLALVQVRDPSTHA